MKLGEIDMPVKTVLAVFALVALGTTTAGKAIDHYRLPIENSERIAENHNRQDAIESALNKMVLGKIIENCAERYSDISQCPEYIEVIKPDGFNLLGDDHPKVRSEG